MLRGANMTSIRKPLSMAGAALASALVAGRSFAQDPLPLLPPAPAPAPSLDAPPLPSLPDAPAPEPTPAPAPAPPAAPVDESPRRFGLGFDAQVMLPVGRFSDYTGLQVGPLLRLGYRVVPRLEVTLRSGYLFGFNTTSTAGISLNVSNIPIWLGARYFFGAEPTAGFYGAAELGANLMLSHFDANGGPFVPSGSAALDRGGFNLGAGYVLRKELPFDVRLQLSYLNLVARDPVDGSLITLGLSVGYTFQL
jgi:hypothetical protein